MKKTMFLLAMILSFSAAYAESIKLDTNVVRPTGVHYISEAISLPVNKERQLNIAHHSSKADACSVWITIPRPLMYLVSKHWDQVKEVINRKGYIITAKTPRYELNFVDKIGGYTDESWGFPLGHYTAYNVKGDLGGIIYDLSNLVVRQNFFYSSTVVDETKGVNIGKMSLKHSYKPNIVKFDNGIVGQDGYKNHTYKYKWNSSFTPVLESIEMLKNCSEL